MKQLKHGLLIKSAFKIYSNDPLLLTSGKKKPVKMNLYINMGAKPGL